MPTSDYKIDGERVPGTTTIINRFKDSGGLNYWYWEQGDKGIPFGKTGKDAASAGTIAHAMVECDLSGKKWVKGEFPEDIVKMAWGAYASYIQWKEQTKLSLVSLETPLISRLYRYGGTPDAIVEIGGKLAIVDIKTSNAIYRDYLLQVAAYKQLWEENNPHKPITGGFHILRFSKENGDFSHHFFPMLKAAWEMFWHLRMAYDLDKELKKRVS